MTAKGKRKSGPLRVLLASHHFLPRHRGGVEVYTARLARELQAQGEQVAVLTTCDDGRLPLGVLRERHEETLLVFEIGHPRVVRRPAESLGVPAVLRGVGEVLGRFLPDVVHFQHLLHLGLSAPRMVKERGLPVLLTLHEYWLLCGRGGQFLRSNGSLCDAARPEVCAACLKGYRFGRSPWEARLAGATERLRRGTGLDLFPFLKRLASRGTARVGPLPAPDPGLLGFLGERQHAVEDLCSHVDRFLAPSRFLMQLFIAHGWSPERLLYWPNGVPRGAVFASDCRDFSGREGPLRVGFLGSITPQKGLSVLVQAHNLLPRGEIQLRIHGQTSFDPAFWGGLKKQLVPGETRLMGAYQPAQVGSFVEQLDVVVVPSLWYENAPLVISEAFSHGLPVVASRLGGMAEMVRDGVDGMLFEPGDSKDLARVLGRLARDRARLARLGKGVRPPRSQTEDAAGLRALYRDLLGGQS